MNSGTIWLTRARVFILDKRPAVFMTHASILDLLVVAVSLIIFVGLYPYKHDLIEKRYVPKR